MANPTGSVILSKGKIETVGGGFEAKPSVVNVGHLPIGGAITNFQEPSTLPTGISQELPDKLRITLEEENRRTPPAEIVRMASEAIRMPLPSAKIAEKV